MSMIKDTLHDAVLTVGRRLGVSEGKLLDLLEEILQNNGSMEQFIKGAVLMANTGWCSHFVARAVSLLHYDEIFKFEEMKPEWIRELSAVSGYPVEELNRIYAECMTNDDYPERDRRENFVVITLEEDW